MKEALLMYVTLCLKGSNNMTRIELGKWKPFLASVIAGNGFTSQETADRILAEMEKQVLEHLICMECDRVLPDYEFYIQQSQSARRGRAQLCKQCWKVMYAR